MPPLKIGVFDSGVGGLTVLRSLQPRFPDSEFLYLGDTARLPYGSKSQTTIARYAVSSSQFLIDLGAEFLVIACNTASALALAEIRATAALRNVSVVGVIEPGAEAASSTSITRDTLVMATSATVQSHAYAAACATHGLRSLEKACPLLVPLVEEGWIDHPVTAEVLRIYLSELRAASAESGFSPDAIVLGCTHYPLLRAVIESAVRDLWPENPPRIIDSAEATAKAVELQLHCSSGAPNPPQLVPTAPGSTRFYATDSVAKFRELGSRFLGEPIREVELVDLGG